MLTLKYQLEDGDSYYLYTVRQISVQSDTMKGCTVISAWESQGSDPFDIFVMNNEIVYVMNGNGQTVDIIRAPCDAVVSAGRVYKKK